MSDYIKYNVNILFSNKPLSYDRVTHWNHIISSGSVFETVELGDPVNFFGTSYKLINNRRYAFLTACCSVCGKMVGRVYLKNNKCINPLAQFPLFTRNEPLCCPRLTNEMRNHDLDTTIENHPKSPDDIFCKKVWGGKVPFDSLRLWAFQSSGSVKVLKIKEGETTSIEVAGQAFHRDGPNSFKCANKCCRGRGVLSDDSSYFMVTQVHVHPLPVDLLQKLPQSAAPLQRAMHLHTATQDGPRDQGSPARPGAVSRRRTGASADLERSPQKRGRSGSVRGPRGVAEDRLGKRARNRSRSSSRVSSKENRPPDVQAGEKARSARQRRPPSNYTSSSSTRSSRGRHDLATDEPSTSAMHWHKGRGHESLQRPADRRRKRDSSSSDSTDEELQENMSKRPVQVRVPWGYISDSEDPDWSPESCGKNRAPYTALQRGGSNSRRGAMSDEESEGEAAALPPDRVLGKGKAWWERSSPPRRQGPAQDSANFRAREPPTHGRRVAHQVERQTHSESEEKSEGEAAALPPEHVLSKAPREGASPSRRQRPTQARTGREASTSDSEKCGGGAVGSRDAPQSRASISPESASLIARILRVAEELRLRASKKNEKQEAQQLQRRRGDAEPPHASDALKNEARQLLEKAKIKIGNKKK